MRLWPLMVEINEREGVSVTTMQARLARKYGVHAGRRTVRKALDTLVRFGILGSRSYVPGARRIYSRRKP